MIYSIIFHLDNDINNDYKEKIYQIFRKFGFYMLVDNVYFSEREESPVKAYMAIKELETNHPEIFNRFTTINLLKVEEFHDLLRPDKGMAFFKIPEKEYLSVVSEIHKLEELISETPLENKIDLKNLNKKLEEVKLELSNFSRS